jgi:methyl-accepting chemotaxis protein
MKKKTGIGFRIITMAVILSVIAAVIGGVGLYTTKKTGALAEEMYKQDLLCIEYTDEMHSLLQTADRLLRIASEDNTAVDEIKKYKDQFALGYTAFQEADKNGRLTLSSERGKELYTILENAAKEYVTGGLKLFDMLLAKDFKNAGDLDDTMLRPLFDTKINPTVEELVALTQKKSEDAYTRSIDTASLAVTIILASILAGLAVSLTLGITITRSITKPVTKVVNNLSDSSSQIAVSSTQLSSSSQEIANGAQEQASSIEETTSSMEELSSMVKQNLGNTRQASLLSEKATEASQNGFDKMSDMLSAMNGISKSTEDIKNVIDVIDDISFQTNMLALNAAVEAARAGEAGMGFAVVADEVKNLANRSSESAKETAAMIKETLKNVEDGMTISKELSEIFKEILANSKKVMEMNREVETASGQQDEGIAQVNKALIQFDTVVQANASGAEETAGAAEELQGQVGNLNEIVDTLYLIVSGKVYENKTGTPVINTALKKYHTISGKHHNVSGTGEQDRKPDSGTMQERTTFPASGKNVKPIIKSSTEKNTAGHTISFEDDEEFKPV